MVFFNFEFMFFLFDVIDVICLKFVFIWGYFYGDYCLLYLVFCG